MTQSIYHEPKNNMTLIDQNADDVELSDDVTAPNGGERPSIDVQGLIDLAKDTDNLARQRLLETVTRLRFDGEVGLTMIEEKLVDEILCQLLPKSELATRKNVALKVCGDTNPTRRLLSHLISEEYEVAQLVLEECANLNDFDLIAVIRRQSSSHRLSIARRNVLSQVVTDKLIDCDEESVMVAMLENKGSHLSKSGLERLVERSKDVSGLQKALLSHPQITTAIAYQIFWWASGDLRSDILKNRPVDKSMLDDVLVEVAPSGLEVTERHEVSQTILKIAEPTHGANVSEIVEMIRSNRLKDFVETTIDHLGISTDLVRHALLDRGGEAFAVLCRAIGADRHQFNTMCLMMDHKRFGKARPGGQIQHNMEVFKSLSVQQATATLAVWEIDDLTIA